LLLPWLWLRHWHRAVGGPGPLPGAAYPHRRFLPAPSPILSCIVAEKLAERWKQPVVIEIRGRERSTAREQSRAPSRTATRRSRRRRCHAIN
jgi:hypothetical protein